MSPTVKQRNNVAWRAQKKATAKQARKEKREAAKRAKWNEQRKEQRRRRRRRERLGVVPANSSYITVPSGPAPPPLPTRSSPTTPRELHPLPPRPHLAHPLRLPTSTAVPLPSFERPLQAVYPSGLSVIEWVDPVGKFVRRKVTAEGTVLVQREGRVPADSLLAAAMVRGEYGGVPEAARASQRVVALDTPYRAHAPQVLSGGFPMSSINGGPSDLLYPTIQLFDFSYPTTPSAQTSTALHATFRGGYPSWNGSGWYNDHGEEDEEWSEEDEEDGYQGPYDEQFYEDMERDLAFVEWEHGPYWDSD